ncbi:cobalt transporter CbiM [Sporolactobacillus sp. THM19-2]|uniref:cobalt transporter CbiM n=1 Tax=Sporolactobacillus sp. THM19-2 TaxID=2511171 RepID=UPI0010202D58|nr:cobalt transporter CbiM [Sporolactobacillus sp. THM19-2]RYL88891.1 cobalt transporter CbiM [Sporolactobacillus sp. THM19-2]
MHIPDNYLSPETCLVMGAAMVPVLAVSIRRVRKEVQAGGVPLIGVGAALSFLVMMFNIPVPGGTTAHAVGGTLLSILLGPAAACLALSAALLIQALFFGDGGLLALGANLFNMAFVMPYAGYAFYRMLLRLTRRNILSAAVASWVALNLASLFAGIEFGVQPLLFSDARGLPLYAPYPPEIAVPAMLIPSLTVAGAAEMAFTAGVLSFLKKVSPAMLSQKQVLPAGKLMVALMTIILLTPLGLLAAADAWGEWSRHDLRNALGYLPHGMAEGFDFHAPLADYTFSGLPDVIGYILSALAGTAVLVIVFRLLKIHKKKDAEQ